MVEPMALTGKKADAKLSSKKGSKKASENAKPIKKSEPAKDPKKPKSGTGGFMEKFRNTFKEKNPNNKSVSVVGKPGNEQQAEPSKKPVDDGGI